MMEKIKTIDDVLKLNINEASKKQLQEIYKISSKLMGCYYDDYNKFTNDQLKYEIANNLYKLSIINKQEEEKYLNKAYEFNNSISEQFEGLDICTLNTYLRSNLIQRFIKLGGKENLDKAYEIFERIPKNKEEVISEEHLNELAIKISTGYEKLSMSNKILDFDIIGASKEELQEIYKISSKLMGFYYDNCNNFTNDQLKYKIAYNFYRQSIINTEKKQEYLDKAYKFNDSISGMFDGVSIIMLNISLRSNLIQRFIELGGQDNLDKAYTILQQILENPEGINKKKLDELTTSVLTEYEKLNLEKKQYKIQFSQKEKKNMLNKVLNFNVNMASKKQLQEIYKISSKLIGFYYDDYNKLFRDELKYKIASNLCCFYLNNRQEKQKCLNKAYDINNLIIIEFDIVNINKKLRSILIEEFIKLGGQENLDKAYTILQQVLDNPKGIDDNYLTKLISNLLTEYNNSNLGKENQDKIQFLKEYMLNEVLNFDISGVSREQLQDIYIITKQLMEYKCCNCNNLSNDKLNFEIAHNLLQISSKDKQNQQQYLDKAYEFNNLISKEFNDVNIFALNTCVRIELIEEFIKLGGQEDLDKADIILQQVSKNPGLTRDETLNKFKYDILNKRKQLALAENQGKIKAKQNDRLLLSKTNNEISKINPKETMWQQEEQIEETHNTTREGQNPNALQTISENYSNALDSFENLEKSPEESKQKLQTD